jgi:hypothetical protein
MGIYALMWSFSPFFPSFLTLSPLFDLYEVTSMFTYITI